MGNQLKQPKFEQFEDMTKIKDSMQMDSGITIAALTLPNGNTATIEVRGEVKVYFNNEYYCTPSEFPQELKDLIANKGVEYWNNSKVSIIDNNWFEIFYMENGSYVPDSDAIDVEDSSRAGLYEILADFVNQTEGKEIVPATYKEFTIKKGNN